MKLLTTLALCLMGSMTFAQSFQAGFETGVLSNSLDKGLPGGYYRSGEVPHWKVPHLTAGLFGRLQTNTPFAFELQTSFYEDHYASFFTVQPSPLANQTNNYSGPTHTTTYDGKLNCNIVTFTLTLQYCLNGESAIKHNKPFKHYIGLSFGYLANTASYEVKIHDYTAATYGEYNSKHSPSSNLLGAQYLATYDINHHVVLSLNLSLQKNTTALFYHTGADLQENFAPASSNSYELIPPTYYFNCLAGIAYKF